MTNAIQIDIVSDIVCPWCYIGKRRLEQALGQLAGAYDVRITFHPFQLDPSVPREGQPFADYMKKRFGGDVLDKFRHVEEAGRSTGLDFRFAEVPAAINTLDLHRILHATLEEGIQYETKEALMRAYFLDRLDLSDPERIAGVLEPLGWPRQKTRALLASDEYAAEVQAEINHYRGGGISGVPFFIFNRKYGVSGAQPAEVLASAIGQVAREMGLQPLSSGDACELEEGDC